MQTSRPTGARSTTLHLIGRGALTDLSFDPSTRNPPINAVYNPADLVGFVDGVNHLYGELEVRWDRRRTAVPRWEIAPYTTGWLASAFVGGVLGLDGASNFAHYGFDLQKFFHLALGPRMLVLRLRGEGVTGDVDEVPFSELPYLGGDFLRGYDYGRFRDRVAAFGTAQYTWDLSRYTSAFLFVDAGRVYPSLDDLTFDDMRIGYGGGLQLQTEDDFIISGTTRVVARRRRVPDCAANLTLGQGAAMAMSSVCHTMVLAALAASCASPHACPNAGSRMRPRVTVVDDRRNVPTQPHVSRLDGDAVRLLRWIG